MSKSKETFTFLVVAAERPDGGDRQGRGQAVRRPVKRFQDLGRLVMDKREFDALTQSEREPGKDSHDDLADETAATLALAKINDPDVKPSDLIQQSVRAGNVMRRWRSAGGNARRRR